MVAPVGDSYAVASGVIVAGRFSGVPAAGEIGNYNLNTAFSVDPDLGVSSPGAWYNGYYGTNSMRSMFGAWNGAIWCPGYSSRGALAWYGGGHGANIGNFATVFDFTDKTWRVIGFQNLAGDGLWQTDGSADVDWKDFQLGSSRIYKLNHQYRAVTYISPGYAGIGARGALYLPLTHDLSADPAGVKVAPHFLDLETGVVSRAISNIGTFSGTAGSGNAASMFDAVSGRAWVFTHGSSTAWYVDMNDAAPRLLQSRAITKDIGAAYGVTWIYQSTPCYVEECRMLVLMFGTGTNGGALTFELVDFSTGWPVIVNATIPAGVDTHGGLSAALTWDSTAKKFYIYEGGGDDFCLTLTPSSLNFRTCSWSWGKEQFAGTPAYRGALSSDTRAFGRMQYVPVIRSLAWCDGPDVSGVCFDGVTRSGVMQVWKTPGIAI